MNEARVNAATRILMEAADRVMKKRTKTLRAWRSEYLKKRYLDMLSPEDLRRRYEMIRYNLKMVNEPMRPGPLPVLTEKEYFMRSFVHVCEEFRIRELTPSTCIKKAVKLPPNYQQGLIAFEAGRYLANTNDPAQMPSYLVRYSSKKHITDLYNDGSLIVRPGSFYSRNKDLTDTQTDQELERFYEAHPSEVKITDPKTGQDIPALGNVTFTTKSEVDYWQYSMSTVFDVRLFTEYGCDACLIIKQPEEYIKRLVNAFYQKVAGPHIWGWHHQPIHYLDQHDPNLPPGAKSVDVYFTKSIRYYYEKEYRIAWVPTLIPVRTIEDELISLNMGPVKDICDLIILE